MHLSWILVFRHSSHQYWYSVLPLRYYLVISRPLTELWYPDNPVWKLNIKVKVLPMPSGTLGGTNLPFHNPRSPICFHSQGYSGGQSSGRHIVHVYLPYSTLYMLHAKLDDSTIFKVFCMTWLGFEPQSFKCGLDALTIRPPHWYLHVLLNVTCKGSKMNFKMI